MNAYTLSLRLAGVALLAGAALVLPVSAKTPVAEPMMDYGLGQFATLEEWSGARAASGPADDSYVMDYGMGYYATVAEWQGDTTIRTAVVTAPDRKLVSVR